MIELNRHDDNDASRYDIPHTVHTNAKNVFLGCSNAAGYTISADTVVTYTSLDHSMEKSRNSHGSNSDDGDGGVQKHLGQLPKLPQKEG